MQDEFFFGLSKNLFQGDEVGLATSHSELEDLDRGLKPQDSLPFYGIGIFKLRTLDVKALLFIDSEKLFNKPTYLVASYNMPGLIYIFKPSGGDLFDRSIFTGVRAPDKMLQ